jgi:hypothetical protein
VGAKTDIVFFSYKLQNLIKKSFSIQGKGNEQQTFSIPS